MRTWATNDTEDLPKVIAMFLLLQIGRLVLVESREVVPQILPLPHCDCTMLPQQKRNQMQDTLSCYDLLSNVRKPFQFSFIEQMQLTYYFDIVSGISSAILFRQKLAEGEKAAEAVEDIKPNNPHLTDGKN